MRIYLTGFMGSGKTTVGRILAGELGYRFVDLDQEIERISGKAIAEIIQESEEAAFRKLEAERLQSTQYTNTVVATGGGCFIYNREWMLQTGTVVYLQAPFAVLAGRIGADPLRPLWRKAEQLFQERQEGYLNAHVIIDASGRPEQVALEIRKRLQGATEER